MKTTTPNKNFLFRSKALLLLLLIGSLLPQLAIGQVAQSITVGPSNTAYTRNADNTVYKTERTGAVRIGDGFKEIKADVIYLIGIKTDNTYWAYIDGNWTQTIQTLTCKGKNYTVRADRVITSLSPAGTIGNNCDILRCENDFLICHSDNGTKWKYNFKAPEWWTNIKQIITIKGITYYVRADNNTIWKADNVNNNDTQIGIDCKLLISNDETLVCHSMNDTYWRYAGRGQSWNNFTPKYISASPTSLDEGFWSIIQNKSALEPNYGLTINDRNEVVMALIPQTGDYDKFLWRIQNIKGSPGTYKLINKHLGPTKALDSSLENPSIGNMGNYSGQQWYIEQSNLAVDGTNAFLMRNTYITPAKGIAYSGGSVSVANKNAASTNQVWLFHMMQMVEGYMLPKPTVRSELGTYNKKLAATNNVAVYGTNTVTDWAVVNSYFILNNVMNAVKNKAPLSGVLRNFIIVGKNDDNPETAEYPMLKELEAAGITPAWVSQYRGGTSGNNTLFVTEEMMCKTGVVNRPSDTGTREFEQVIHEFTHSLQYLGWIALIDAQNLCPSEIGRSSECFCWYVQAWFNSTHSLGRVQRLRSNMAPADKTFMGTLFNATNTWMPPHKLRQTH